MNQSTFRPPQGPCYTDLRGKVALVTGGGGGIGRGICLRLADEGMHVVFCGRTQESLQETAELIEKRDGQSTPLVADISKEEDIARLAAHVREQHGRLDVLVHNAALMAGRKSLNETDQEFWRRMFATNIDSAYFLVSHCRDLLLTGSSIVFISTIGAQRAHRGMAAYDSSKGAMDALTRSLAVELAEHRIRVNAIAPGPIAGHRVKPDSPRRRRNELAFADEIPLEEFQMPHIPISRYGTPAEIAAAVAFLASTQASYITGQILNVDGGATAQLAPPGIWI